MADPLQMRTGQVQGCCLIKWRWQKLLTLSSLFFGQYKPPSLRRVHWKHLASSRLDRAEITRSVLLGAAVTMVKRKKYLLLWVQKPGKWWWWPVVFLHWWQTKLHHITLTPPSQRNKGRKYDKVWDKDRDITLQLSLESKHIQHRKIKKLIYCLLKETRSVRKYK